MAAIGVDGTWYVLSKLPAATVRNRRAAFEAYISAYRQLLDAPLSLAERTHQVMEVVAADHALLYDRIRGT